LISLSPIRLRSRFSIFTVWQLSILAIAFSSLAQSPSPTPTPTPPAQEVPVIDGGVGPCSVEFTVTDANAKPQYAATVKVRIAYGFAGVRKLNLEAGTNVNGKVKFKGLPVRVHNPPLEFTAVKDELTGAASYNPATECEAKHDIVLEKPKAVGN
jgi:hypothetical protein